MESEVVSSYFSRENENQRASNEISDDFLHLVDELNNSLENIKLPRAIECIYNPTLYARQTFEIYIRKYCNTKKDIMYFGMNPGPWGMSQTGVPFGEIKSVRDWLGIDGPVNKPLNQIKNRPVQGFQCTRTEVSGKRFWGVIKQICGTPDNFFKTSFVYNYLPQQWMKNSGCNLTPGDFKVSEMQGLFSICDETFIKVLELYEVKIIVAIGKFCEIRAQKAIKQHCTSRNIQKRKTFDDVEKELTQHYAAVLYIPHPSPRAVNNNNWETKAVECMKNLNLLQYYQNITDREHNQKKRKMI